MTFKEYLAAYPLYHRHPVNKALHIIGIPLIIVGTLALFSSHWKAGLGAFVVGWIAQFVGHWIEGSRPAFVGSPVFLFAAPIWYVQTVAGAVKRLFRAGP